MASFLSTIKGCAEEVSRVDGIGDKEDRGDSILSLLSPMLDGVAEELCVDVEHDDRKISSTPRQNMSMYEPIRLCLPEYGTRL